MKLIYRMLNELHHEIEHTDSRIDSIMKKATKVLHLSNGMYSTLVIYVNLRKT